jgi:predicted O-methyltransferase YrrM
MMGNQIFIRKRNGGDRDRRMLEKEGIWMDRIDQIIEEVESECRRRYVFMLGPQKARFLGEKLREKRPALVVECGTAIGYSGLVVAKALKENGKGQLITVEIKGDRAREAQRNFERAEVAGLVDSRIGDAVEVLKIIEEPVDFLLLDNGYENYYPCFRSIESRLADGALILADNVGVGSFGMQSYLDYVRRSFESRFIWFDTDLPWMSRDAMELTIFNDHQNGVQEGMV